MGKHSSPASWDSAAGASDPGADDGGQGRRRKVDGGRRGVSVGVIAALVAVVILVGGVITWRYFGHALSRHSEVAAQQCLQGTATVAVVADPSIADHVTAFADNYQAEATPVGDKCVQVAVTTADSDAVITGLTDAWPAELGERPALWIPASSIQVARLQAAVGTQLVSDARSLVNSPVALAVKPQLKAALGQRGWAALPGLQTNPAALDPMNLPGWGSLRLALPGTGAGDATYLTVEAVASTSAPPNTAPTTGLAAATTLLAARPKLAPNSADEAWKVLTGEGNPASAPVHAVAITEQQLFRRTADMPGAGDTVAAWSPPGPAVVADYPTVLLSGPWLSPEQVAGASEFARFMRKDAQLAELVASGFRSEGSTPERTDVLDFAPLAAPLPPGDDNQRAALAGAAAPAAVATTTIVLNEGLTGDEGGRPRLTNVAAALRDRIGSLPPAAAVGLWTFNKIDSAAPVPTGPLADQIGTDPRAVVLSGVLGTTTPTSGGGASFTTVRAAFAEALTNYRRGQPNSVLLVTQGPHTDQTLDAPGLQAFVKSTLDPNRPVAVNVIAFGGDPDRPTWESVAGMTGGKYAEVPTSDSPDLIAAVNRLLG